MTTNHWNESSVESLRANTLYVLLTLAFGAWFAWDAAVYRLVLFAPYADYWEHTAVFTEWLRNFGAPGNPHVDDPSLSSRYMPWFWLLTWIGVSFGLDSVELMGISAVANYALVVIGLHVFLKSYFRDNWAPIIGFLVVFFFWGVSWNWSNLYHLRSFFYVAAFPSTFVFGLSLLSFALVPKLLRKDGSNLILAIGIALMSALMFVCHPLTGVFGIGGCAVLAITEPSVNFRQRMLVLLALFAGTLFAEAWPYFSVWKVALGLYGQGAEQWFAPAEAVDPMERFRSGAWRHIFYNPRLVFVILGPALLGIPLCLWLLIRRQHLFIVLGAASMAVPYVLHLFVEVPLAHRFLLFMVTYFHFAIVWGILRVIDSYNIKPRPPRAGLWLAGTLGGIAALIAFNLWLVSLEFQGRTLMPTTLQISQKSQRLPDGLNTVQLYERLTDPLPDDAIVLTTPEAGWPLPTVKGKVVSIFHENPLLLDQAERYVATTRFFTEVLDEIERAEIVRTYLPGYLLLDGKPGTDSLADWIGRHAIQVAGAGDFRMYRLLPTADDARRPEPTPEPTQEPLPAEEPAVVEVPSQQATPAEPVKEPMAEQPLPEAAESGPAAEAVPDDPYAEPEPPAFGVPIGEPVVD